MLTLLSDAAEPQPLICVVDDAHWLDRCSAQVLSFVARRLQAESVIVLFAERDHDQPTELAGLPELALQRLSDADARELLASSTPGRLDERVRQRIIDGGTGNPLALLELPRGLSSASLAGGFAVADSLPLASRVEASFRRRVDQLPRRRNGCCSLVRPNRPATQCSFGEPLPCLASDRGGGSRRSEPI